MSTRSVSLVAVLAGIVVCGPFAAPAAAALADARAPAADAGSMGARLSAGEAAVALWTVGASFALDEPVRAGAHRLVEQYPALRAAAQFASEAGGARGLPWVVGLLWLADPALGEASARAVAAGAAAAYALKMVVGRPRPLAAESERHGMSGLDAFHSFPSGHATVAFALAAAVGEHRPAWREEAYAAALAVALSRVVLDAHWASDVVAGALLGAWAGRAGWSWSW